MKNGAEPKFRRINLAGKAGRADGGPRVRGAPKALGFLDAGDGHLELPAAVAAESLAAASAKSPPRWNAPPPAPAAEPRP